VPNNLLLSSSPHIYSGVTTRRIMLCVIIALLPAAVFGVVLYGLPALAVILTSVVAAVASEAGFRALIKRDIRVGDLSAVVTGLLLALIVPPSTPLWMVGLGALFAIVIAKEFFGGLGSNPFNPALIGRAFMLMSFPAAMTTWHSPFAPIADAYTTATPLHLLKAGQSLQDVAASLGVSDTTGLCWNLFIGTRAGCIGESSVILLLAGAIFLLIMGVISWFTPVAMLGTIALLSWILGANPLVAVLSGGAVLGAFYMATDYSSTPMTPKGKVIFGIGAGLITVLIRKFGGYPEGITYGILIMNALTPYLNKLRVKKYGFVKPAKPVKEGSK
jgi:Na+-translocating ferredoxin:NAD+ oxidoreductase subunit D